MTDRLSKLLERQKRYGKIELIAADFSSMENLLRKTDINQIDFNCQEKLKTN